MSFFLRLAGITNAAVWFGTAIFFTLAVWPAFFSREMVEGIPLPLSHSGAAANVMLGRYFVVQYWCAAIALGLLVMEWLYAGKPLQRWPVFVVTGLLALTMFCGLMAKPRLSRLHLEIYGRRSTPQQREEAGKSYATWRGVVRVYNVILILGLWAYIWEVSRVESTARFVPAAKFRG